jgi:predicted negative regulator of RcsB-dependent stress response
MQNQLTEFAQLEHYRRLYKSRGTLIIVFSLLSFTVGFAVAKFLYKEDVNGFSRTQTQSQSQSK